MTEETLEFKLTDSWKKALAKGDIFPIVPEFATGSDGTKYMRPQGRNIIYRVVKENNGTQEYVCNNCNSEIKGAEVRYSEITDDVHVSGHAAKEELKFMLGLTMPKFLVPIGGEIRHGKMFASIAKDMGIKRTYILKEGDTLIIEDGNCKLGDRIKTSEVMIDGTDLENVKDIVIRDRQVLSKDGIFLVIVTIDKNSKALISDPEVVSRGFVYMKEADKILDDTKSIVIQTIKAKIHKDSDPKFLRRQLITSLEKYIYKQTEMRPMILPVIIMV